MWGVWGVLIIHAGGKQGGRDGWAGGGGGRPALCPALDAGERVLWRHMHVSPNAVLPSVCLQPFKNVRTKTGQQALGLGPPTPAGLEGQGPPSLGHLADALLGPRQDGPRQDKPAAALGGRCG